MKKIFALILAAATFTSAAFSNDHLSDNTKLTDLFNRSFATATDVRWQYTSDYSKVAFRIDGQRMFAYYTPAGELMAVTRYLGTSQLPIDVAAGLKKHFQNQWLTDLFEVSMKGVTSYVAELTSADKRVTMKTDADGVWQVLKKERIAGK